MYTNNLKIYFTKQQYFKFYSNIGSSRINLEPSNSYYILGIYYNSSILNLNIQIYKLKTNIIKVLGLCSNAKYSSPLVVSTTKNKYVQNYLKKKFKNKRINNFMGLWWNGLLINFKRNIRSKSKRKLQLSLSDFCIPNFCLYISDEEYDSGKKSCIHFYKESNGISLCSIYVANAETSNHKVPSVLFSNTKSLLNNLFFNNLFVYIVKKTVYVNKKYFLVYLIKKWKLLKLKLNFNIIVEYNFCKYKNNKILWVLKDDLK